MLSLRKAAMVSVVGVLAAASLAWGQATARMQAGAVAAPAGKPAPILEVMPAGSLGFVVIQNVGKSASAADQYLKDIGVADMPGVPPDLLAAIKEVAKLGDGLNANGGFAAVMLDPAPFGIDFLKMIKEQGEGAPDAAAEKPKVPVVLFVPATGIKEVFGQYEMSPEGELTKIKFRAGEGYAAMLGGYAVVSPNLKAVQAVLKAQTPMNPKASAAAELSKDMIESLASTDVAIHVNVKTAGPLLKGLLDFAMQQASRGPQPPMAQLSRQFLPMWSQALAEVRDLTYAVQFGKTGLILQESIAVEPNGWMGQTMAAAAKSGQSAALDRLPNLPYILAIASVSAQVKNPMQKDMMDMVLKMVPGLTEQSRGQIGKISEGMQEQVTGSQMVIGGSPEGAGVFGIDMVISCKDSAKVKALLSDAAATVTEVIQGLSENLKPLAGVKVAYAKDAEKLDTVSVDAIEISLPALTAMKEDEKAALKGILGEDKLHVLVASPDDKTVVMTFGGSTAMLTEAIKAAKGGGAISKDPGVVEAMKVLPAKPQMLLMLDAAHAMAVAGTATGAMGVPLPPIQITAKTPLAMGGGIRADGSAQAVIFVPNDLVKNVVEIVGAMFASPAPRRTAPLAP